MMDLSIIVPVYNVEKYVRTCIESIYRQGLDEDRFELIIVNDGSKDKSMEVIADIIQQHSNIIVIEQENQGLSVARNNGIAKACGEFLLMPDSDDYLLENSLEPLLDLALESKSDLVVADFFKMTSREIDNFNGIVQQKMNATLKTGWQMLLEDLNPYECYVWRTIYRHQFLVDNQLRFIPGIRFQDVPFTHEVYLKAKICIRTSWILNIYRIEREGAATNGFDLKKAKDFSIAIGATWELTHTKDLPSEVVKKLIDNIHANLSSMIYSTLYTINESSEKAKVVKILLKEVPDLKFNHNLFQRVETLLLRHSPHFYIFMREIIRKWKKLI